MKKFIFPIFMILFVVSGAVAADFVKNSGGDDDAKNAHSSKEKPKKKSKKDDGHGAKKKDSHSGKKKKSKGHGKDKGGHGAEATSASNVSYLKFKRQFVVPVMTHGKIDALVIMNLNLELDSDAPANAYSLEPKLRDAITRELLALSNEGIFGKNLTSAETYENLRRTLLGASQAIISEGIRDVLILDLARQDQ